MALARLCEAFPEHPDWMKWYSAAALHSGESSAPLRFEELSTGLAAEVRPDSTTGRFRARLPEGVYKINGRKMVTLLPGGTYRIDPGYDFELSARTSAGGRVTITATVQSGGPGRFVWEGKVTDPAAPWVAVVVPDNDLSVRKELLGSVRDHQLVGEPSGRRIIGMGE